MNLISQYLGIFFVLLVIILILTNADQFSKAVKALSEANTGAINAFKTKA